MERLDGILLVAPGPGDAPQLALAHVRSWQESYHGLLPGPYLAQMNPGLHARRFRRALANPGAGEFVLAAEGRDGLVGYCAGRTRPADGFAEISTLYLIRAAQKIGLGRRLVSAAARVVKAQGANALGLWVLTENRAARGFYEHLGGVSGEQRPVSGWGGRFTETTYRWADIRALSDVG